MKRKDIKNIKNMILFWAIIIFCLIGESLIDLIIGKL